MPYRTYNKRNICIYYQEGFLDRPEVLFERCDSPSKRGKALFFEYEDTQLALKHYYRGGFIGRLICDTYTCLPRSTPRMLAEFKLLSKLREQNLPVPEPIAARSRRRGLLHYSGDLVTKRIPAATPLSQQLNDQPLGAAQWRRIGKMIARFHAANVYHADLNATNILLDINQRPWLIDFDKSDIRTDGSWKASNLRRLRRSLNKLCHNNPGTHFQEDDWQALLAGYGVSEASIDDRPYSKLGVIAFAVLC